MSEGDLAIDATAGNGADSCWIAKTISPGGELHLIDLQVDALTATLRRLEPFRREIRIQAYGRDHAKMAEFLPDKLRGQVRLICFNLGYLPRGDHSLTTTAATTRAALEASMDFLASGGCLSVMAYRGHPGGAEECLAVEAFFQNSEGILLCERTETGSLQKPGPVLFLGRRL